MNQYKGTNLRRYRVITALGGKCTRCGYDKCFAALELHHTNLFTKNEGSETIYKASVKKQLEEAKKCQLVCSNCHREIHAANPVANSYKRKGLRISGYIPYGEDLGVDGKTLVKNKREQTIIKKIIRLRRTKSLQAICNVLNEERVPTKQNKIWFPATVKTLLGRHSQIFT